MNAVMVHTSSLGAVDMEIVARRRALVAAITSTRQGRTKVSDELSTGMPVSRAPIEGTPHLVQNFMTGMPSFRALSARLS